MIKFTNPFIIVLVIFICLIGLFVFFFSNENTEKNTIFCKQEQNGLFYTNNNLDYGIGPTCLKYVGTSTPDLNIENITKARNGLDADYINVDPTCDSEINCYRVEPYCSANLLTSNVYRCPYCYRGGCQNLEAYKLMHKYALFENLDDFEYLQSNGGLQTDDFTLRDGNKDVVITDNYYLYYFKYDIGEVMFYIFPSEKTAKTFWQINSPKEIIFPVNDTFVTKYTNGGSYWQSGKYVIITPNEKLFNLYFSKYH